MRNQTKQEKKIVQKYLDEIIKFGGKNATLVQMLHGQECEHTIESSQLNFDLYITIQ